MEEIVAVRTFRSRLPVRRVRHMDRRGQEVQNHFLTDHTIILFFLVPQLGRPEGRSGPPAPAPSSSTGDHSWETMHDGCDRNAPFHRGDPANH